MIRNEVITKGKKILELWLRGVDGEKEAAKYKLDQFLIKHNITLKDLNYSEELILFEFKTKNKDERMLLIGCFIKLFDNSVEKKAAQKKGCSSLFLYLTMSNYKKLNENFTKHVTNFRNLKKDLINEYLKQLNYE